MELAQLTGRRLGLLEMSARNAIRTRLATDRGEGVVSMAIAILVVAALGAAMYLVFESVGDAAGDRAETQINKIGTD